MNLNTCHVGLKLMYRLIYNVVTVCKFLKRQNISDVITFHTFRMHRRTAEPVPMRAGKTRFSVSYGASPVILRTSTSSAYHHSEFE